MMAATPSIFGFGEEALEDGGGVGTNMPAEMADYGVLFADGALASMRLLVRWGFRARCPWAQFPSARVIRSAPRQAYAQSADRPVQREISLV